MSSLQAPRVRRARVTQAFITKRTKQQSGKCFWCGLPLNDEFHVDHVIPVSRGGDDGEINAAISCTACNVSKGARLPWRIYQDWAAKRQLLNEWTDGRFTEYLHEWEAKPQGIKSGYAYRLEQAAKGDRVNPEAFERPLPPGHIRQEHRDAIKTLGYDKDQRDTLCRAGGALLYCARSENVEKFDRKMNELGCRVEFRAWLQALLDLDEPLTDKMLHREQVETIWLIIGGFGLLRLAFHRAGGTTS